MEIDFKHNTQEGISTLQAIHDISARAGAVCEDPNDPLVKDKAKAQKDITDREKAKNVPANAYYAEFVSKRESKIIQQVHDATRKGGAKCNSISGFSYSGGERKQMVDFDFGRTTLATFASMGDRVDLRTLSIPVLERILNLVEEEASAVVFNGGVINESNRDQVLADAARSAAEFIASKNKGGGRIHRTTIYDDEKTSAIRESTLEWLKRKRRPTH